MKKFSFKSKLISFSMLLVLFSVLMVPIASANGGHFSFDCYHRQVDGWSNGQKYTLTKGKVHLDAHSWLGDDTNGSNVYITLDRKYGLGNILIAGYGQQFACILDKSKNVGESKSISYSLSWNINTNSSNYYLVVDCDGEYVDKYGFGSMCDY